MSEYLFKGLSHIGVYTADPKKCADFYVENLGFHHYHNKAMGPMEIWFVENNGCVVEFIKNDEEKTAGVVDHICLEVQGIDELAAELKAKGVELEKEEPGVLDGLFPVTAKNIFFKGPAGERIELFDFSYKA